MSVYVVGTAKRLPYGSSAADRIGAYSTPTPGGCWQWQGAVNTKGYGVLRVARRLQYAHRLSYAIHVGPIPEGLQLDHLCRVRRCVNPDHLEPVTNRENAIRGIAARSIAQPAMTGVTVAPPAAVTSPPASTPMPPVGGSVAVPLGDGATS